MAHHPPRPRRAPLSAPKATTVHLDVTPRAPRGDPDRLDPPLPEDLAAALRRAGVRLDHGWSRHGPGPERMRWQVTGPDRVAVARRLERELRSLGYDAEASVRP